jgi:hypothetical protein
VVPRTATIALQMLTPSLIACPDGSCCKRRIKNWQVVKIRRCRAPVSLSPDEPKLRREAGESRRVRREYGFNPYAPGRSPISSEKPEVLEKCVKMATLADGCVRRVAVGKPDLGPISGSFVMAEISRKELILLIASVPHIDCGKSDHLIRLAGVDLSNLDLTGLNLAKADLAGANLRGCNLTDANLSAAELSSADLTDAVLRGVFAEGATLLDATLARADFRESERNCFYGTHFMGANFDGADLTDARLCRVRLSGARFCQSILCRADFTRARVNKNTLFTNADMTGAIIDDLDWSGPKPVTRSPIVERDPDHTPVKVQWSSLKLAV